MGRPTKTGADYFPHDKDMRNDPRIKALRRKFRGDGYMTYCMLLESLADSDNFCIGWSDLDIEIAAGDFDIEPEVLSEIVDYCCVLNLLQLSDGILACVKLTERLAPLMEKREYEREKKRRVVSMENPQMKGENNRKEEFSRGKEEFSPGKSTQSKVKKSKEKDIDKSISKKTADPQAESPGDRQASRVNFKALVEYFNTTTKGAFGNILYPLSANRKTLLNARIKERGKESFVKVVEAACASSFLRGQNNRGFTATFDWLIKPENYEKVLSGNYENKPITNRQAASHPATNYKSDDFDTRGF